MCTVLSRDLLWCSIKYISLLIDLMFTKSIVFVSRDLMLCSILFINSEM